MNKKLYMNLSMFNLNTQTTTLNTTGNDLSPEMKTFYDKNLIRLASPLLVHDQFAQKRNIPKNGGKDVEFRKIDGLAKAMTPLTEGVTPDGNRLNVTSLTARVSQYGDYITLSDVLELTTIDPIQTETQRILADQAGRTLDTITRDVMCSGTNVMYAGGRATRATITATDTLKVVDIQKAVRALKAQNAKPISGGYFVAIIHPDTAYDIMRDTEWIDASKYAGAEQLFSGEIGRIRGCRFIESTEAKVVDSTSGLTGMPTGVSLYFTMVLGADFYGTTEITGGGLQYIITQLGSGGSSDPLGQRATMGWKAIKTAEILVQTYGIRIESASTFNGVAN